MFKKLFLLNIFLFVLLFISGCSKSEQTYWDEAVNNQKAGKYKEAVTFYQELAEAYPESKNAVKALFEIAKIYQVKMIKEIEPKQSMLKAIEFYNKIYNEYAESPEAPKSLFMKAFIESNELQNYDAAKKTYSLFLQKYPGHEMAASAKAELETIGLTPEEILSRNARVKK
jgi:TolA-binding protein